MRRRRLERDRHVLRVVDDTEVELVGVEAGGRGPSSGDHAARFSGGTSACCTARVQLVLQDEDGQIAEVHSISAGLDYPASDPSTRGCAIEGRAGYYVASDDEDALAAFRELSRLEGIIPALETSHAFHYVLHGEPSDSEPGSLCLSGRGDKDLVEVRPWRVSRRANAGAERIAAAFANASGRAPPSCRT